MRLDGDGYLYFDRAKDMVKSGGENVYSIEVETVLLGHPAVADAAVIGVPDERWSKAVKAVVVAVPTARVTAAELDRFCRARMAGYKRPRWYEFTDAIERSPIGKAVKRELRAARDPARCVRL